jgi:hypothetical protein
VKGNRRGKSGGKIVLNERETAGVSPAVRFLRMNPIASFWDVRIDESTNGKPTFCVAAHFPAALHISRLDGFCKRAPTILMLTVIVLLGSSGNPRVQDCGSRA